MNDTNRLDDQLVRLRERIIAHDERGQAFRDRFDRFLSVDFAAMQKDIREIQTQTYTIKEDVSALKIKVGIFGSVFGLIGGAVASALGRFRGM